MRNKPPLLDELKRRNVIRMAGLYLVGAWLLTQVASTVLPTFDVPSWALRGLIITLALGFIPALIFSWIFELTPQGLKRDEDVRPEQSIAPQTARRMDRMINCRARPRARLLRFRQICPRLPPRGEPGEANA
jgi:hypothetical protein